MIDMDELRNADIATINPETLVDINDVKLKSIAGEERVLEYIAKVKNPYCFLCDGYVVKLVFADADITMTDRLCDYISRVAAEGISE